MKKNKIIVSLFATVFLNFNVMQVLACNAPSTCTQKVNTSCSGTSKDSKSNKCESDKDEYDKCKSNKCGSDEDKYDKCQSNECKQKSCGLAVQNYCKTTAYNTPVSGAVVATDKSKHTLAYTKACDPCHGSVTVNSDGTWTYQPKTGFTGCDSFKVKVSDGKGATAVSTVSITVEKPKLTVPDYKVTTNVDTKVTGTVEGKGVYACSNLCYSVTTSPTHGTVKLNSCTHTWEYTPNCGYVGEDNFKVTVREGWCSTAVSTVTITVVKPTTVNHAPTIPATCEITTDENKAVSGKVVGSDVDTGDTLTYAKASDPSHGSVTVNGDGSYTYTPGTGYVGTDSFTVTVSDGKGGSATGTVTVTVNAVAPVNHAPTITDCSNKTDENKVVSGAVVGSDVDTGDALTYAKASGPSHGSVTVNADGSYTYTPAQDYVGTDSFTVTVSDGKGGSATGTVNVTISAVNHAPTVTKTNYDETTDSGVPITDKVEGTDADGDVLSYVVTTTSTNGTVTIDAVTGSWTYTPNEGFVGNDSFIVTVSDGKGGIAVSTINITVNDNQSS